MPLDALTGMDLTAAKMILVAAVGAQDYYPVSADHNRHAPQINAVLAEIRDKAGVSSGDPTPEQSGRVARALSKAMTDVLLNGKKREDIKAKMGRSGRLPISAYDVTFFRQVDKAMGEKARFIEGAIRTADLVQHVEFPSQKVFFASLEQQMLQSFADFPRIAAVDDRKGTTLVLKRITDKKGRPELLFAHALRRDSALEIQMVGRLHSELFAIDRIEEPSSALAEWVDRYGVPFRRFPGMIAEKLVQDLPVPDGIIASEHRPIVEADRDCWFVETGESNGYTVKDAADGSVLSEIKDRRVIYAYAVDTKRYRADRLRLGA